MTSKFIYFALVIFIFTFSFTWQGQQFTAYGQGANHSGPYDPTNVGDPSYNGSENGKHTGRPDAGTVGNADDKNPKGQYPSGSDDNAGYECDRNQGIGQTNPAHTGCKITPTPTPTTVPLTHTPTPTPTISATPSPTVTPTPTITVSPIPTVTPTNNPTATPTPTPTVSNPTPTHTNTPSSSTSDSQGSVLGASTLPATGISGDMGRKILFFLGGFVMTMIGLLVVISSKRQLVSR